LSQIANLLPITKRTIERYPQKKHFNRVVSEQIIQIAGITAQGVEIFGDKERFLIWLNRPSKALGGKTPISLTASRFGAEMVLDELGRLEYGVIS
jgi:putative toxin-antitoxin system antitoxin component (TIGR02293 family)